MLLWAASLNSIDKSVRTDYNKSIKNNQQTVHFKCIGISHIPAFLPFTQKKIKNSGRGILHRYFCRKMREAMEELRTYKSAAIVSMIMPGERSFLPKGNKIDAWVE